MQVTDDAQVPLLAALVGMGRHFDGRSQRAADLVDVLQERRLQPLGRSMGLVGRIQVQRQPVHQLVQRVVIHQPAQTLDHRIGHHVLACDGRQRIAADGLGIAGRHQ